MKDPKNALLIDTGFLVALNVSSDKHHQRAREVGASLKNRHWITTWPVLAETCHLLERIEGNFAVNRLLELCEKGLLDVFLLEISHIPKIKQLMKKYEDLPMDLADASLVILAESLNSGEVLSTDQRDFKTYRWKNHSPFKNLLLRC